MTCIFLVFTLVIVVYHLPWGALLTVFDLHSKRLHFHHSLCALYTRINMASFLSMLSLQRRLPVLARSLHKPDRWFSTSFALAAKKKHTGGLEKPKNAYIRWCADNREAIAKEINAQRGEVGKVGRRMGEVWRSLSDEEKQPYHDAYARDMEQYKKDVANELSLKQPPPQHPRSAYLCWVRSLDEKGQVLDLGSRWKAMGPDEQATWKAKFEEAKRQYEDDLAGANALKCDTYVCAIPFLTHPMYLQLGSTRTKKMWRRSRNSSVSTRCLRRRLSFKPFG
eukprot:TRINITY_DN7505_c0_g1_i1.p1 TRINITY_DN7505_c0_g1~~TRINITY_DN7505_c0_g1_i1.p1  ORF type:complete len:280 (+),score=19.76 TRINITY_DN7505_c0_g1_i1:154-993(+)